MNRAYSILTVKAVEEGDERVIRGIATTPEPDRMGDIVEPLGVKFKNPMPLLHQHDSRLPVGLVKFDKPTKSGITFEARLPTKVDNAELQSRIDLAWAEIKAGLIRAVSIGFRSLEHAYIEATGGIRFIAAEVLELSLVTIPAQAGATILEIRSIDTSIRAASGIKDDEGRPVTPGASGKSKKPVKAQEPNKMKKTIAEQISAFEATRANKSSEMATIMDAASEKGETLDASQKETYDTLKSEVGEIDEHLVRLRDHEKAMVLTAKEVKANNPAEAAIVRQPGRVIIMPNATPKGLGFVRMLGARFMAREDGVSPADIALSKGWGDELATVLRTPRNVLKTAVNPATTTDTNWAAPLVTYNNLTNEFIEILRAKSILTRIPGLRRVPFNVKIPREIGEMTGYWVAQGSPKPLTAGSLDTVTLDFAKVAGITYLTQELLRFSQPNAEQLMINSLTAALNKLVDNDFLDPSKAEVSGESPASITNGVTPIAASGTTADAFRADFGRLLAAYTAVNYNLDDLVIVMSQTQALRLGLMRNDFGSKEFPDINKDGGYIEGVPVVTSENIAANGGSPADGRIIVALSASSILLADDGGVDVDISTEASVQAETAPDSPATASTVMISFWQRNLVGIRCERFLTWKKARTGSVQYMSGANYGV